ncbi:unnamed protein product [Camellia sinensis]
MRQRNQMVKLKTEFGEWCDMDEAINNQLFSYFQKLFKASEARDMTEALSVVDCEVTEAMNADLTKPLTDAEIKLAAFQLGPLKAPCPDGFSVQLRQHLWGHWCPLKLFGKERTIGLWKNVPRFIPSSEHEMQARYDKAKSNDGYNRLQENVKVIGTWDDHDFGLNDAGKEFDRKITNQRLMLDFLDEPQDSPRRKQAGVYASYTFGPAGRQVKVILLDTRYHRDPLFSDGNILGNSQWTWLEKELNGPASAITIIGSSIQRYIKSLCNNWPFVLYGVMGTFPKGEDFKLIDDSKGRLRRSTPKGWSLLHKRRCHFGEITRYDCASGYPLYDITSSGLTQAVKKAVLPPLHFLVRFLAWLTPSTLRVMDKSCRSSSCTYGQPNFGAIEINWDATPVSLKIEVGDANGFPVMSVNTTLLELQARNSKITVEAGEYQKYCSLEVNLPWIVRYRLVIFFFCALAGVAACADIFHLYGYISLHAMSPEMQA